MKEIYCTFSQVNGMEFQSPVPGLFMNPDPLEFLPFTDLLKELLCKAVTNRL